MISCYPLNPSFIRSFQLSTADEDKRPQEPHLKHLFFLLPLPFGFQHPAWWRFVETSEACILLCVMWAVFCMKKHHTASALCIIYHDQQCSPRSWAQDIFQIWFLRSSNQKAPRTKLGACSSACKPDTLYHWAIALLWRPLAVCGETASAHVQLPTAVDILIAVPEIFPRISCRWHGNLTMISVHSCRELCFWAFFLFYYCSWHLDNTSCWHLAGFTPWPDVLGQKITFVFVLAYFNSQTS